MSTLQIVMDTNVFYSALRSQRGASYLLLKEIGKNQQFQIHLSVPLVLEYEEIAKRDSRLLGLTHQDIDDILDFLCSQAALHTIHYLWRPFLTDIADDMVLELAVESHCDRIITYNHRDFRGIEPFGVAVTNPNTFLSEIGVLP